KWRADLWRIWQKERKTIPFVTHDIEEAVQLADRVMVMSRRPATIQTVVEIDLPRPRDLESSDYLLARDRIFTAMGMNPHSGGESLSDQAFDYQFDGSFSRRAAWPRWSCSLDRYPAIFPRLPWPGFSW